MGVVAAVFHVAGREEEQRAGGVLGGTPPDIEQSPPPATTQYDGPEAKQQARSGMLVLFVRSPQPQCIPCSGFIDAVS